MRTGGFGALLELLGCPGIFPAAGPPEKEFLGIWMGPCLCAAGGIAERHAVIFKGQLKQSGNAQRKSPGISAFVCVAFLIDSALGMQIFRIVVLGLLHGKLALFRNLGNDEIFLASHLQQGGNKAENTLLQAFLKALLQTSLIAFFKNILAVITHIGCPPFQEFCG